jgi:hypothetical protein
MVRLTNINIRKKQPSCLSECEVIAPSIVTNNQWRFLCRGRWGSAPPILVVTLNDYEYNKKAFKSFSKNQLQTRATLRNSLKNTDR